MTTSSRGAYPVAPKFALMHDGGSAGEERVVRFELRRRQAAKIQWNRIVAAGLAVFLVTQITTAFARKFVLAHQINVRLQNAELELTRLQKENITLKLEKEALYTLEKIEQLAREKLGLSKPNEIPVKVIQNEFPSTSTAAGRATGEARKFWKKIKEALPAKWLLKSGRS